MAEHSPSLHEAEAAVEEGRSAEACLAEYRSLGLLTPSGDLQRQLSGGDGRNACRCVLGCSG